MMYATICVYRVPPDVRVEFLRIQRETAAIYREYGALEDETFSPADLAPRYGCESFADALSNENGVLTFISLSRFRDKIHHDEVMQKVDADFRINALYNEIASLIDIHSIIRGEFERRIPG